MSKKKREQISGIEAKYEEVRQLLVVGKERGFLAYDEINESLPDEISSSPDEIEEVFTLLESHGITVVDADAREQLGPGGSAAVAKEVTKDDKEDEGKEVVPGPLEKTNDPVRMYLREMGTVPLLTREGEVRIARRIERGERRIMNALARSAWVHDEIRQIGERIKKGQISANVCSRTLPAVQGTDTQGWTSPVAVTATFPRAQLQGKLSSVAGKRPRIARSRSGPR